MSNNHPRRSKPLTPVMLDCLERVMVANNRGHDHFPSGTGVTSALRSLERRGLVKSQTYLRMQRYVAHTYQITEAGRATLKQHRPNLDTAAPVVEPTKREPSGDPLIDWWAEVNELLAAKNERDAGLKEVSELWRDRVPPQDAAKAVMTQRGVG